MAPSSASGVTSLRTVFSKFFQPMSPQGKALCVLSLHKVLRESKYYIRLFQASMSSKGLLLNKHPPLRPRPQQTCAHLHSIYLKCVSMKGADLFQQPCGLKELLLISTSRGQSKEPIKKLIYSKIN